MVCSLYRSRKYRPCFFFFYKSQIKSKMKYCCHICAGAGQYPISSFGRVQYRLRDHVADYFVFHPTAALPSNANPQERYHYFPGKYPDVLHSSFYQFSHLRQELKSPTFLPYSIVKEEVPLRFFRELLICGINSRVGAFLNT